MVQSGGYGQAGRTTTRGASGAGSALRSQQAQFGGANAGGTRPNPQAQRIAGGSVVPGQASTRSQQIPVWFFFKSCLFFFVGNEWSVGGMKELLVLLLQCSSRCFSKVLIVLYGY